MSSVTCTRLSKEAKGRSLFAVVALCLACWGVYQYRAWHPSENIQTFEDLVAWAHPHLSRLDSLQEQKNTLKAAEMEAVLLQHLEQQSLEMEGTLKSTLIVQAITPYHVYCQREYGRITIYSNISEEEDRALGSNLAQKGIYPIPRATDSLLIPIGEKISMDKARSLKAGDSIPVNLKINAVKIFYGSYAVPKKLDFGYNTYHKHILFVGVDEPLTAH